LANPDNDEQCDDYHKGDGGEVCPTWPGETRRQAPIEMAVFAVTPGKKDHGALVSAVPAVTSELLSRLGETSVAA